MKVIQHHSWVFVFGSNLAGRHGKGAALAASRFWGAESGVGEGLRGQSYAIPTKDAQLAIRPLACIELSVRRFLEFASQHQSQSFMVTRIGCGLAGYSDAQIAPLFADAPANVYLPRAWIQVLQPQPTFRLILAGSRSCTDYNVISREASRLLQQKKQTHQIVIISGGAKGVDQLGERFARENDLRCVRFPAHWDHFNKPAGFVRNGVMAWYSDALLAFWDGRSPGTQGMIKTASEEGLAIRVRQL